MTVEEPVDFTEKAWIKASSECKDLVLKLLLKDSVRRISFEKAINHKFFDSVRDEIMQSK